MRTDYYVKCYYYYFFFFTLITCRFEIERVTYLRARERLTYVKPLLRLVVVILVGTAGGRVPPVVGLEILPQVLGPFGGYTFGRAVVRVRELKTVQVDAVRALVVVVLERPLVEDVLSRRGRELQRRWVVLFRRRAAVVTVRGGQAAGEQRLRTVFKIHRFRSGHHRTVVRLVRRHRGTLVVVVDRYRRTFVVVVVVVDGRRRLLVVVVRGHQRRFVVVVSGRRLLVLLVLLVLVLLLQVIVIVEGVRRFVVAVERGRLFVVVAGRLLIMMTVAVAVDGRERQLLMVVVVGAVVVGRVGAAVAAAVVVQTGSGVHVIRHRVRVMRMAHLLDGRLETVFRVGRVLDQPDRTVRLHQTVVAPDRVAVALLVLLLYVARFRVVDAVLEPISRIRLCGQYKTNRVVHMIVYKSLMRFLCGPSMSLFLFFSGSVP